MNATPIHDTSRLCIHTQTTKPLSLEACCQGFSRIGAGGITVWRNALEGRPLAESKQILDDSGLEVVSLCRGGFFPAHTLADRQKAIDENKAIIDEAAAIGAPLIVLVVGAVPGIPLVEARKQIRDGIAACLEHAQAAGVKLAIEPLHPMYAGDRSAVTTLAQANDMAESLNHDFIGVAVDVYHLWMDDRLEQEIYRCGGGGNLFAFHICDWKCPTTDMLLDRGIMGEGCIPVRQIRAWVEATGFKGFNEVEIFSSHWWAADQQQYLDRIREGYLKHS
ncbi:MAG: sugar phosphate isomerase/epimerase family protein [Puniceicoccaceae bacterium]